MKMKIVFNFMPPVRSVLVTSALVLSLAAIAATVAIGCGAAPPAPPPPAAETEQVRRFCAILDYVASDYAGAVKDGAVQSPDEYAEQLSFLKDAAELAGKLPPARGAKLDPAAELARVADLVDRKAPP